MQSDKASVDITSPYDGTVKEILVQEGQIAKVGEDLCIIETDEEASKSSDIPTSETVNTSPPPLQEQKRDTPTSQLDASDSGLQPPSERHPVARRLHPLDPNFLPSPTLESVTTGTTAAAAVDVLALPAVRHFARESGVDITLLAPGSGKNGRVERVDVERYLAGGKSGSVREQPTAVAPSPAAEDDVVVELGRTRYGMWKAMEKARIRNVSLLWQWLINSFRRAWRYLTLGEPNCPLAVCTADAHIAIRPRSI